MRRFNEPASVDKCRSLSCLLAPFSRVMNTRRLGFPASQNGSGGGASCRAPLRACSRDLMRDLALVLLCRKRCDSLPVSTIWQWCVSRSSKAVVILASPNTLGQWPMQREPGSVAVHLDMHGGRSGTWHHRHPGGHETAGLGLGRGPGAYAIKPRLPAPRVRAPACQHPLGNIVGRSPHLALLARGPVRRHHLQASLHAFSIHVHLVSFVD